MRQTDDRGSAAWRGQAGFAGLTGAVPLAGVETLPASAASAGPEPAVRHAAGVPGRLTFIDVARTLAVLLALLAHGLNETGALRDLGGSRVYLTQLTRTATPLFVFMFGFMVEYVYGRRLLEESLGAVRRRLRRRSVQCYLAFALTSLAAVAGSEQTWGQFVLSLLFMRDAPYGNILRIYSAALIVLPGFLLARRRLGVPGLYASLAGLLLLAHLLTGLHGVDFGPFGKPVNVLLGIGSRTGGPSVLHAFIFVLAGMLVATAFDRERHEMRRRFAAISMLLAATVLVALAGTVDDDVRTMWLRFADYSYRARNHPAYFAIGIATTLAIFWACFLAFWNRSLPRAAEPLLAPGRASLVAYTFGNVMLVLADPLVPSLGTLPFLLIFLAATLAVSWLAERVTPFIHAAARRAA